MQDTSIAWADWTWNPIRGCSRISPGCMNCYAEKLAARHSVVSEKRMSPIFEDFAEFRIIGGKREAHWTGKVELIESKLLEPLSWRRKAVKFRQQYGRKPRAFISMSDLFHESLDFILIDRVFAVMALCEEVNFMILTKRADRLPSYITGSADVRVNRQIELWMDRMEGFPRGISFSRYLETWPIPNVALGVSVESQKYLDRVCHLHSVPAAMKFISYEPALESVDWEYPESIWPKGPQMCCPGPSMECGCMGLPVDPPLIHGINMILIGGESGPGARPFDIAWARQTVKQCRAAGTAPFVKQMGAQIFDQRLGPECLAVAGWAFGTHRDGKRVILKDKKGEDMSEWPEDVRVREWPEGWN